MKHYLSHLKVCLWAVVGAIALSVGLAQAGNTTAPYYHTFGADALGTVTDGITGVTGIGTEDGGMVVVTNTASVRDGKSVYLSAGGVDFAFTDGLTNVVLQAYVKPVACTELPSDVIGTAAGAVCVLDDNGTHKLYAFSETNWVECDQVAEVDTDKWLALAAHVNYGASNWVLYAAQSDDFVTTMSLAHSEVLDFYTGTSHNVFSGFSVTNENPVAAHLDAVAVSKSFRTPDVDHDVLQVYALNGKGVTLTTLPPYTDYTPMTVRDGSFNSSLGNDMSVAMRTDDSILMATLDEFILNSSGTWSEEVSNAAVQYGQGVILTRDSGTATLALYPTESDLSIPASTVVTLGGTNAPARGRTDIAIPMGESRTGINDGILNSGMEPTDGDRLYYIPASGQAKVYYWAGSNWCAMGGGGVPSTDEYGPGDTFVYLNFASDDKTWTLTE